MRDADGQPLASIGVVRDITDRKRDETEKAKLEAQNLQLQKAESLGRMAGAIAHHFNNQFHVVMGNLEMAMDGLPSGCKFDRKPDLSHAGNSKGSGGEFPDADLSWASARQT